MINELYNKYFQKSRAFLFPALGIKKTSHYLPVDTYVCLAERVFPEDIVLVVVYNKDESEGFRQFEKKMLLGSIMFQQRLETKTQYIYLFNYEFYKDDWFNFLLGKYSKLSTLLKGSIKAYYGEGSKSYAHIDSYLYPEKYFERYAELLNVDVALLKKTGELCDSCDLVRETLVIPVQDFVVLDKSA